jgi:hypothetical protein
MLESMSLLREDLQSLSLEIAPKTTPILQSRTIDDLPTEIRQQIISYLDLETLKSIRLASQKWAYVGQSYLIEPCFNALPTRDDFNRLLEISQHPYFSSQIERIVINSFNVHEYQFRHNVLCHNYTLDSDVRAQSLEEAMVEFTKYKGLVELYSEDFCRQEIMEEAFSNLQNLKAVDIKTESCLLNHPALRESWKMEYSRGTPSDNESRQFIRIVTAARNAKLQSLSHDPLAIQILKWDNIAEILQPTFAGLTTLKLCFDWLSDETNEGPVSYWMTSLANCLKTAPSLRELNVGFRMGSQPRNIHFNFSLFEGFVWPHMHTFALDNISWDTADIQPFLIAHSGTLKRLRLWESHSNIGTQTQVHWPGPYRTLVDLLKIRLKLEKLDLKNFILYTDFRMRSFTVGKGVYDYDWKPLEGTLVKPCATAKKFEDYVIHNGPYPFIKG